MSDAADTGGLDHLKVHRRLILERSILAGVVGLVPVPIIDDLLTGLVRGRMVRRLAEERQVDLTPSAVLILAEERQVTMARNATLTAVSLLALRYAWRKVFVVLALSRRVEEMVHTFQIGTLFDHYCLRFAIDQAVSSLHHELATEAFKKSGATIVGAAKRVPVGLWDLVRHLGRRGEDVPAEQIVDDVTETFEREGLLRKAARVVDDEMGAAGAAYLASLVARFDTIYGQLLQQEAAAAAAKTPDTDPDAAPESPPTGGTDGSTPPPTGGTDGSTPPPAA
jgi:uncharacterized protein (DUF697 family)